MTWESAKVEKNSVKIEKRYDEFNKVSDSKIDFKFYENEFEQSEEIQNEEEKIRRKNAVAEKFKEQAQESLKLRKEAWKEETTKKLREEFVKELLEKIRKFKELEESLSSICYGTGFLWGMAKGEFKDSGFEILNKYADLLQREESLLELARILGKHSRAQVEYEKELRAKTSITTEYKLQNAFKGQIAGLKMSNDISSVLPSELALMKNPATKKLFALKFAQKQLLSFKYMNQVPAQKTYTEYEQISREKKEEQKGPIIICVDTSGSMSGRPETIAKSITFALMKVAVEEKRSCYLINFSTGIETLNLTDFSGGGESPLSILAKFLRKSFDGGTDAMPALEHAIKMLKTKDYKTADIMMISDFCVGSLSSGLEAKIKNEQKNDTDFYSLVIGNYGNKDTISCFNYNLTYDDSSPNAAKNFARDIATIKENMSKK